jgi:hypothetical protein
MTELDRQKVTDLARAIQPDAFHELLMPDTVCDRYAVINALL